MTAADALRAWLDHLAHERRLSPRTLEAYGHIGRLYVAFLERHRGEALSLADLGTITAAEVREWYDALDPNLRTARTHAYALMRTIMGAAASDGLVDANPVQISGAGSTKRVAAAVGEGAAVVSQIHGFLARLPVNSA